MRLSSTLLKLEISTLLKTITNSCFQALEGLKCQALEGLKFQDKQTQKQMIRPLQFETFLPQQKIQKGRIIILNPTNINRYKIVGRPLMRQAVGIQK